jgi:hypothetical protein
MASGTHVFKVSLLSLKSIRREIEIGSNASLHDFAEAIVRAFEFEFDHAFGFYSKLRGPGALQVDPRYELFADIGEDSDAGSVEKTKVGDVFQQPKQIMLFLFDYGDNWEFRVELLRMGERQPRVRYPRLLKKMGRAPEQYPAIEEFDD